MNNDPIRPADELEALKRENADLRQKLERSNELHRLNNEWLVSQHPYEPMTEAEIHEMLHAPRGESLLQIVEEYERSIRAGE
ncbi:MAG: hypothetical protein U0791_25745 [Gemmataceae bacterium]